MIWKNTATRYGAMAQTLHWLTFALLLGSFGLGLYMIDLPLSPQKLKLISWHKWVGVTVFALALARLAWRMHSPPPPLPAMAPWQRHAAGAVHALIYLLLFLIPITGWIGSSAKGISTVYLGLVKLPDPVSKDPALADFLFQVHWLLNKTLLAAVAVHVAAALKHQFLDRDGLLERMLPSRQLRETP